MPKTYILATIIIILLIALGGLVYFKVAETAGAPEGNELAKQDLIKATEPISKSIIKSPLKVKGEARGYWFFEASFPVRLVDENGNQIGETAIAQAKSDWMTESFVPFEASIEFQRPDTKWGILILEKDNPSGLPENADELRIPVRFY